MSSFLKSIFQSSNKHKKLCEEWTNTREPVADGITFYVRYLGSSLVEDPKSAESTAAGVKRVIHSAKAAVRRPERVALRVAMEGVRIDSATTGDTIMDTSIYKISYCSADARYEQVLAFVSSTEEETCECHAFLCSKRKVAEAIAVSIAQAFTMAYECWKLAIEAKRSGQMPYNSDQMSHLEGSSPSRSSKEGNSGASSPAHSSPPSEVSSTSGYQSSSQGGLLLEFDDSGSQDALQAQPLALPSTRKHWTSFDGVSDLTNEFTRLNSDRAKTCLGAWDPCAPPAAPASSGGSQRRETPHADRTKTSLSSFPRDFVGSRETTVKVSPAAPMVLSVSAVDAIAPSAQWTPRASLTPSSSCWPSSTDAATNRMRPPGTRDNDTLANDRMTQDLFNAIVQPCNKSRGMSNTTNQTTNTHSDAMFSNLANNLRRSRNSVNSLSNECIAQSISSSTLASRNVHPSNNFFNNGLVTMVTGGVNSSDLRQPLVESFSSGSGGTALPLGRWESFDSSPPPLSVSISPSPSLQFSSLSTSLPPSTATSATALTVSTSHNSLSRCLSPTSAFLDSCLTPRPDEERNESRFAFVGRLSGEGSIFNPNTLNDKILGSSACRLNKPSLNKSKYVSPSESNNVTSVRTNSINTVRNGHPCSDQLLGSRSEVAR